MLNTQGSVHLLQLLTTEGRLCAKRRHANQSSSNRLCPSCRSAKDSDRALSNASITRIATHCAESMTAPWLRSPPDDCRSPSGSLQIQVPDPTPTKPHAPFRRLCLRRREAMLGQAPQTRMPLSIGRTKDTRQRRTTDGVAVVGFATKPVCDTVAWTACRRNYSSSSVEHLCARTPPRPLRVVAQKRRRISDSAQVTINIAHNPNTHRSSNPNEYRQLWN